MPRWREYFGSVAAPFATAGGSLHVLHDLRSPQLNNCRDLFVYLPPSYASSAKRYPVLYMHDGQNLFDPALSFSEEWGIDDSIVASSCEAIVVGIPNIDATRMAEYSPFPDREFGGGRGDAYLDFIIDTIKPIVDRDFRTLSDAAHTGIGGASMGGLISLYAYFARHDVFGRAAVMSPSLWFGREALFAWLEKQPAFDGRLYVDIGTQEGGKMLPDCRHLVERLREKDPSAGFRLQYSEAPAVHHESAWSPRFRDALPFIVGR